MSAVLFQKLWSVFICLYYLLNVTYLLLPLIKCQMFISTASLDTVFNCLCYSKFLFYFRCSCESPSVHWFDWREPCGKMSDLLLPTVATTDKCTWITWQTCSVTEKERRKNRSPTHFTHKTESEQTLLKTRDYRLTRLHGRYSTKALRNFLFKCYLRIDWYYRTPCWLESESETESHD